MKKVLSIILSIFMLFSIFIIPSFALTYGDFSYEIVEGKVIITGYNGSDTDVTIPATVDGVPVIKVNDDAFKDNEKIISVTVSEGVEDIGSGTFENCTNLSTISLPETIIHIGEKAIYNTAYYNNTANWRLKKTDNTSGGVNVGNGNASIEWEDIGAPVLEYLYLGKNLIEIELVGIYSVKSDTLVIADAAFKGNAEATYVSVPTSLKTIGNNAFEGCTQLKIMYNLEYVDYIGDNAFKDCITLDEIKICDTVNFNANTIENTGFYNNEKNWTDNVLYMGTRAVGTRGNDEVVIKEGTTDIISCAINNQNVVIPKTVTTISSDAFVNTENLKIFGYTNSYAEEFANENNIKFMALDNVIKGDVNFNGKLDQDDYEILSSVTLLKKENTYLISLIGDMNEDNAIDGLDVVILDLILNDIGPSTIKGDVDGNGQVNEHDYEVLVKITSLKEKITNNYMFNRCDINDDGAVDNFDAVYLDLALNGLVAIV